MSQRTILSALLAMTAFAGPAPASWAQDARLSSRPYKPDEIVRVEGKLNVQATIAFGEGEKIENVAVGDSDSWQIAPNKRADLLFIKPLTETARTNMTVVTDRHTYFFDLVASPKSQPIYALRFTYATPAPAVAPAPVPAAVVAAEPAIAQPATAAAEPASVQPSAAEQRAQARRVAAAASAARADEEKRIDDQRKADRQAARARAAAEAKRAADAKAAGRAAERAAASSASDSTPAAAAAPAATTAAAPAWKRSGPRELMPQTIYDDGRATYAVWPPGRPLPQLLVADAQGREVPVDFAVDGERIVIPGVPGRLILRANGRSGTLEPGRPATAARPASAGQ